MLPTLASSMNPIELNIGNWILIKNVPTKIKSIDFDELHEDPPQYFIHRYKLSSVKPLPLNEEWILKLGWYKDADKYGEVEYIRPLCNFSIRHAIDYFIEYQFRIIAQFKYVHQLQNIYFAITNTELTIK